MNLPGTFSKPAFLCASLAFFSSFLLHPFPLSAAGIEPPSPAEEGRAFLKARSYRLALERFLLVQEKSGNTAEKAQALFLIGEAQFREKDYASAYQAYLQSLRLNPLSPEASRVSLKSAVALVYQKNYRAALSSLKELEKRSLDPDAASDLRFWEAECRFQTGQYEEARENYQRILHDNPGYLYAHLVRYLSAWCDYQQKKYSAALDGFEKVAAEASDPPLVKLALLQAGESRFRLGRFSEAEKTYRDFLGQNPSDSLEPSALYGLGWALEKQSKNGEAAESFGKVASDHPDHVLAPWAAVRQGVNATAADDLDQARQAYRRCLELAPSKPPSDLAQFGLAWLDYSGKKYSQAAEGFVAVAAFAPPSELKWDAAYLEAGCYYLAGKYGQARDHYQDLSENAPEGLADAASYWMGWCDVALGRFPQALLGFTALSEKAKGNLKGRAFWAAGEAAYRSGSYSLALKNYDAALQTHPAPVWAAKCDSGLGWAHFQQEEYKDAAGYFQKAAEEDPGTLLAQEATLRAGDCFYNLHRYADAQKQYQSAQAQEQEPTYRLDAQEQIGWCAYRTENFEKAITTWSELMKNPQAEARKSRLLYWSAWAEFRGKRFEEAVRDFARVEKQFPQDALAPESRLRRADCLFNLQRFAEAKSVYRTFLNDYPNHPLLQDALYGLQWSSEKMGEKAEAFQAARDFLKKFPDSHFAPEIQFRLADGLYHDGKFQDAASEYRTLLQKYPNAAGAARALFWLGMALDKSGHPEESVDAFTQLLKKYPDDSLALEARFGLGTIYFHKRDFAHALENYLQVFQKVPGHRLAPHALYNSAICEKHLNHPAKAMEYFRKLMTDYAQDSLAEEATLQTGLLAESMGNIPDALKGYEGAMKAKNRRLAVEASFYHASLLEQGKEYGKAIQEFENLIAGFPSEDQWVVTSFGKIAECYEEMGQYSKAADTYHRILKYTHIPAYQQATEKRLKALEPFLKTGKTGKPKAAKAGSASKAGAEEDQ